MNRIDVSAIQPNPSKFLSTDHEEDNLAKQDDTYELPEYSIKPLHPTSQSFLADQGSNSKRHTIFKEYERMNTAKSEQILSMNKQKIQFKIPSIEDYYIKQSRENIHPNRFHRMESMIQPQQREERFPQTQINAPTEVIKPVNKRKSWLEVVIIIFVLSLTILAFQKNTEMLTTFSEMLHKIWKLF